MDVWIIAAAAGVGAGYAVQNIKNVTKANKKCLDLSSESLNIVREKKRCPLRRVLSRRSSVEEMPKEREKVCEVASDSETASTSGYRESFASHSIPSNVILNEEDVQEGCECVLSSESNEVAVVDSLPCPCTSEVGFCYSYERKRSSSLMSRRRINTQSIKPQTSLESCLMAQLYEEHAEYTYSLDPLQKPTVRPFLVTDGIRVISTTPYNSFSEATGVGMEFQKWKDVYSEKDMTVNGVPRLPNLVKGQALRRIHSSRNRENARGNTLLT